MFNSLADKKVMKTLVILFADSGSLHIFDKIFDGKSAFSRSLEWAGNVCALKDFSDSSEIIVFGFEKNAENCKKEISDSGINAGLYGVDLEIPP